jgi:hypothetical protein
MYRVTGDAAHEWIGVSVCAVCIAHNALNWKWYKNLFKGSYNLRRGVMTAINLLLVPAMATLVVTGLLHSRTVLAFLRLPGGMMIRQIHTSAAYWSLPLIGSHIGLNWGIILNAFRKRKVLYGRPISQFTGRTTSHGKDMEHGLCVQRAGMGHPSEPHHPTGKRRGGGATALILAVYESTIEKVEILLKAGADKHIINNAGEAIYDIAERYLNKDQWEKSIKLLE